MANWDRQYKIIAGVPSQQGFEIGEAVDGRALHVSFDIEKNDASASNQCKLQIWNLNDEHKSVLKEKGCVVEIKAGYDGAVYPAFLGDVTNTTDSMDSSDRMTEIELSEGKTASYAVSSISVSGQVVCNVVVQKLLLDMGIQGEVYSQNAKTALSENKFDNGYSFIGKSKDGLSAVLQKCGCTWSMQNGVLQIYQSGESISTMAYLLDVTSGLVNIPKKVTITVNGVEKSGYEINYLMNCVIGVNDLVQVKSKELDGTFRVQKLHIKGDNYDGDWICTAQILEV